MLIRTENAMLLGRRRIILRNRLNRPAVVETSEYVHLGIHRASA